LVDYYWSVRGDVLGDWCLEPRKRAAATNIPTVVDTLRLVLNPIVINIASTTHMFLAVAYFQAPKMDRFLRSRDTTNNNSTAPIDLSIDDDESSLSSLTGDTPTDPFVDIPTLSALKQAVTDTEYKSLVASIPSERKHTYH
jgi:hypothetical protein